MAENNGHVPPEEPEDQQPDNEEPGDRRMEAMRGFVQDIVQQENEAFRKVVVPEVVEALSQVLLPQLDQRIVQVVKQVDQDRQEQLQEQLQAAGETEAAPPGTKVLDLLASPDKLATLATQVFNMIGAGKAAFRQDDYTTVKDIAARNPTALMPFIPDPYNGNFPALQAHSFETGMKVASSVAEKMIWHAVRNGQSPGPLIAPAGPTDGSYVSPTGASPGDAGPSTPTPGSTTPGSVTGTVSTQSNRYSSDPYPSHRHQESSGPQSRSPSSSFDYLPDAVIDSLIADMMLVRASRNLGKQTITLVN